MSPSPAVSRGCEISPWHQHNRSYGHSFITYFDYKIAVDCPLHIIWTRLIRGHRGISIFSCLCSLWTLWELCINLDIMYGVKTGRDIHMWAACALQPHRVGTTNRSSSIKKYLESSRSRLSKDQNYAKSIRRTLLDEEITVTSYSKSAIYFAPSTFPDILFDLHLSYNKHPKS